MRQAQILVFEADGRLAQLLRPGAERQGWRLRELRRPDSVAEVLREGGPVLKVEGSARALLTGERTALNFLAHLSGVATIAARAPKKPLVFFWKA